LGNVPPGTYTFTSVYGPQQLTVTTDVTCVDPPDLVAVGQYSTSLTLTSTVTNNGGPLDVTSYTVTGPNNYSQSGNFGPLAKGARSEERRVGKEWRTYTFTSH